MAASEIAMPLFAWTSQQHLIMYGKNGLMGLFLERNKPVEHTNMSWAMTLYIGSHFSMIYLFILSIIMHLNASNGPHSRDKR